MSFWRKEKKSAKENNRINIIMAIIFLLGGGVLFKLFSLQVLDYDLYIAKANSQHFVRTVIEADRGRVFIQDGKAGADSIYPLASNKKFALLFAIPKDIKDPEKIANALYEVFKKESAEKEAAKFLEQEDKDNLQYEIDKYICQ